jgi:prophage regulatory protein
MRGTALIGLRVPAQSSLLPLYLAANSRITPHQIVPLAETTIYELEQRGEFPRRFNLTARCVVWDLEEIEAWIDTRKQASRSGQDGKTFGQDVSQRKHRPVRGSTSSR